MNTLFEKLAQFRKSNKFDAFSLTDQVSSFLPPALQTDAVKRRMLDVFLNIGIPFNRWLGLRIREFQPEKVVVESPPSVLRRNHVGTVHACAQALIGEMPAGILVAQQFPPDQYRIIIGKLTVDYKKAGSGTLLGTVLAPPSWPDLVDEEGWIELETRLTNEKNDLVAICRTHWQIKSWARIARDKETRRHTL